MSPTPVEEMFAEIYRVHGGYLLRALLKLTSGDRGKAEDILQETMVRAWQHPEAIAKGPEHARPWLFTVARRIAIDHFRMQTARVRETSNEYAGEPRDKSDHYHDIDVACDMQVALAQLPAHHRQVLTELHLKGRTVQETAQALGVPAGTIKSRNFYAVRALRSVLDGYYAEAV